MGKSTDAVLRLFIALLALVAFEAAAQTSYYKCEDEYGRPIFSQRPCGDDAQRETVSPQRRQVSPSQERQPNESTGTAPAEPPASENSEAWDKIQASNRLRDIRREIERNERQISALEQARDVKIAVLDRNRSSALNNLAGATYLESLAQEKRGVTAQYGSLIQARYREVDRLQREAERLRSKHGL